MNISKKLLRTTMIVAAGLVTCLFVQAAHAGTVQVGNCKGASIRSFATITAAVTYAEAQSSAMTIDVCPGYYAEQVTISSDTNGLTLLGVTAASPSGTLDAAVIIPPSGGMVPNGTIFDTDDGPGSAVAQIAVINSTAVTISHITVDAQSNQSCSAGILIGIYYQDSSGTVTDSVARNQNEGPGAGDQCGFGIATESDGNGPAGTSPLLTVSNNSVRNFQKNGIVARGNNYYGANLVATGNTVIGIGATSSIAQNGIEVGFAAQGSVKSNYVADVTYANSSSAATGILFYATAGSPIAESNVVDSANVGIGTYFDPNFQGGGNNATISLNHIGGTQIFDGIDLCSNSNTADSNVIFGSTESGIHIDDACGTSTTDTVKSNTINEACAGILLGTGSGSTITPNTYENDGYETLAGDTCTPPSGPNSQVTGKSEKQTASKSRKPRP
jgi:hypothetical protein